MLQCSAFDAMPDLVDFRAIEAALIEGVFLESNKPACSSVGNSDMACLTILVRSAAELSSNHASCAAADEAAHDNPSSASRQEQQAIGLSSTSLTRASGAPLASSAHPSSQSQAAGPTSCIPQRVADLDSIHRMLPVIGPLADAVFAWTGECYNRDRVMRLLQFVCILPACPYAISDCSSISEFLNTNRPSLLT